MDACSPARRGPGAYTSAGFRTPLGCTLAYSSRPTSTCENTHSISPSIHCPKRGPRLATGSPGPWIIDCKWIHVRMGNGADAASRSSTVTDPVAGSVSVTGSSGNASGSTRTATGSRVGKASAA